MPIPFDAANRARTLAERGLDFADAQAVFASVLVENPDERFDDGEERRITVGYVRGRMVVLVWTRRGDDRRHIISMRKANEREKCPYGKQLG